MSNFVSVLTSIQEFGGEVLRIGQNQCLAGLGIEDVAGQLQQFLGGGRGRAGRGARGETDRLAGLDVEREKGLSRLRGPFPLVMAVRPHVPLAEAAYAMGIDGYKSAQEVTRSATDLAQSHLEMQTVGDRAGREKFMHGHVAGEKRQAIGQLEDPLVQGAAVSQSGTAQRRLVNQLQRQARSHAIRVLSRPAADQVPGAQAQQLGDQQPDAGQVPHDLVGEKLSHPVLDAPRITRSGFGAIPVRPDVDGRLSSRAVAVEFFFAGHTSR